MKTILLFTLATVLGGCAHGVPETPTDPQITCKPKFERRERQELHVMDSEGHDSTAYRQWLILDDGKQYFRIPWGSPPLSRPPVDLYTHQTYTFTIRTGARQEDQIPRVIRVKENQEVVYEAPQGSLEGQPLN